MKTFVAVFLSFFILAGCKAEKKEKEKMSLHDDMATHCIGRNVISLPKVFHESAITTGMFRRVGIKSPDPAFEVLVRAGTFSQDQFKSEVQKRRLEMMRGGNERVNVLRLDTELPDGSMLLRLQEIEDAYISEINFLRGESMVTVRLNSYHDQYLQAEENLIKFATGVRPVSQNRDGVGFCLGKVNIAGDFDTEHGSFWFLDGQGADFEVDIDTYAADGKVPLLERMARPDSLLAVFDVKHKVLRARTRPVAGMQAQEWLGWAKISDEPDAKTLKFALETMRSRPNQMTPSISLTFNTAKPLDDGTPTKTLISDEGAMRLWDAVIDSIQSARVR
jgi:hypothetical protein